jgi:hypothetical protein
MCISDKPRASLAKIVVDDENELNSIPSFPTTTSVFRRSASAYGSPAAPSFDGLYKRDDVTEINNVLNHATAIYQLLAVSAALGAIEWFVFHFVKHICIAN